MKNTIIWFSTYSYITVLGVAAIQALFPAFYVSLVLTLMLVPGMVTITNRITKR